MEINKNCKLFLNEVYSYDIESCHYTILKKLGYNLSNIPVEKEKRNIHIGLMIRENPRLGKILRDVTESTISEYLVRNNIKENDLLIRQYDGFLTTKLLKETELNIPIDLRHSYHVFLISFDRNYYIGYDGFKYSIKGLSNRYFEMDNILKKIIRINFANKTSIFKSLHKIKKELFDSDDVSLFCIPDGDDQYTIYLKIYEGTKISKSTARIIDVNDIDKQKYFDFYIKPFVQSIIYEFI